jgi:hypothetical protein
LLSNIVGSRSIPQHIRADQLLTIIEGCRTSLPERALFANLNVIGAVALGVDLWQFYRYVRMVVLRRVAPGPMGSGMVINNDTNS